MSEIRHKVFILYHHDDQDEAEKFAETFDPECKVFIPPVLSLGMEQYIIDSDNMDYVMRKIRKLYLRDSTVTLVLIGKCTWARRYVDWKIQASLWHGETVIPNGLLGIVLPSAGENPILPDRLKKNSEGYAQLYDYPQRKDTLASWIEDAFQARTGRAHLIVNPRDRLEYNKPCP